MNEQSMTPATDPVCGMTVDINQATAAGLTVEHEGTSAYFCGRGCMLEFRDNPGAYVDASHMPSM